MRINMSASGFNQAMGDMQKASNTIQSGFAQMLNRDEEPNSQDDTKFVGAFVDEKVASRLAEAELNILKTQDEMLGTMLDLKED